MLWQCVQCPHQDLEARFVVSTEPHSAKLIILSLWQLLLFSVKGHWWISNNICTCSFISISINAKPCLSPTTQNTWRLLDTHSWMRHYIFLALLTTEVREGLQKNIGSRFFWSWSYSHAEACSLAHITNIIHTDYKWNMKIKCYTFIVTDNIVPCCMVQSHNCI